MNGTASREEEQELHQLLQESPQDDLMALLQEEWDQLEEPAPQFREYDVEHSWRQIVYPSETGSTVPLRRIHPLRKWWWAAASLLLAIGIGTYWHHNPKPQPASPLVNAGSIQPGREGALLTLADGTNVSLDSIRNGVIALQGGATARIVNGTLVYEGTGHATVYNTTSTPRGRQFQVILPDGTRAWLNAASSIRYPVAFVGSERRVEITGEVYLEVAKMPARPFLVNIGAGAEIEVLGTSFNVNAYSNEAGIHTTLVNGSVRINRQEAGRRSSLLLKPGQQASIVWEKPGIDLLPDVDVEKQIAWKNGIFNFNGASLEEVMRQLERWYDIEVVYEKGIPSLHLGGELGRDLNLAEVLEGLKDSKLHYRFEEGRRLVILP